MDSRFNEIVGALVVVGYITLIGANFFMSDASGKHEAIKDLTPAFGIVVGYFFGQTGVKRFADKNDGLEKRIVESDAKVTGALAEKAAALATLSSVESVMLSDGNQDASVDFGRQMDAPKAQVGSLVASDWRIAATRAILTSIPKEEGLRNGQ